MVLRRPSSSNFHFDFSSALNCASSISFSAAHLLFPWLQIRKDEIAFCLCGCLSCSNFSACFSHNFFWERWPPRRDRWISLLYCLPRVGPSSFERRSHCQGVNEGFSLSSPSSRLKCLLPLLHWRLWQVLEMISWLSSIWTPPRSPHHLSPSSTSRGS